MRSHFQKYTMKLQKQQKISPSGLSNDAVIPNNNIDNKISDSQIPTNNDFSSIIIDGSDKVLIKGI